MMPTAHDSSKSPTADREIVLSRVYDAPRSLVFAAFTDAKHLARWWGPKGFSITTRAADIRPGGVWSFVMHGPDGTDWENRIAYLEIASPERLVYDHDSGKDDDPDGFHVTITFEELDGKTKVVMRSVFRSAARREQVIGFGAIELGRSTLDKLAALLPELAAAAPGPGEIRLERVFDAPRRLVFAAWTEPHHFTRWFGPRGIDITDCRIDARAGGVISFCHVLPDGGRLRVAGAFRVVQREERLVFDVRFVDDDGKPRAHPMVPAFPLDAQIETTVTFSDDAGRTRLRVEQIVTPAAAAAASPSVARERALARAGWGETLDRLGELLASA